MALIWPIKCNKNHQASSHPCAHHAKCCITYSTVFQVVERLSLVKGSLQQDGREGKRGMVHHRRVLGLGGTSCQSPPRAIAASSGSRTGFGQIFCLHSLLAQNRHQAPLHGSAGLSTYITWMLTPPVHFDTDDGGTIFLQNNSNTAHFHTE
jgi:hypothetical protein